MSAEVLPFNPLDKKNLGASVAEAMLSSKVHSLGNLPDFRGAGIYAIYYSGEFEPYREISVRNAEAKTAPIYVGKAVPAGARKGGGSGTTGGRSLFNRLSEHAESIQASENLEILDFTCRFLVVDDIWIPLGESLLIARYAPLWNSLVDGFGNHDPGSGRYNGMRPRWDVLHPGRDWARKCRDRRESQSELCVEVESYLRACVFATTDRFIQTDIESQ